LEICGEEMEAASGEEFLSGVEGGERVMLVEGMMIQMMMMMMVLVLVVSLGSLESCTVLERVCECGGCV